MKALEFTAEMDAERRVSVVLPATFRAGPVRVLVLVPETFSEEETPATETELSDDPIYRLAEIARQEENRDDTPRDLAEHHDRYFHNGTLNHD